MTQFDPSRSQACSALNSAYEAAEAEMSQSHEPASAGKVARLYKLMVAAEGTTRASHSQGGSGVSQGQREFVTTRHATFLGRLDQGQRTVFVRMETALRNGLNIPKNANVEVGTDETSRTKEITSLKAIIDKLTGQLSSQEKSKRLNALLGLEWRLIQLLASQPEDVSDDEKAKTAELCSLYMGAIADDFADKIKGCTTLKGAVAELEKATQFFARFKGYPAQLAESVLHAAARKSIEAFWEASDAKIGGSELTSQVNACKGDREAGLAMYQALELRQQLLFAANREEAGLALNASLKQLNDEFAFDEALLATQVKELGVQFKSIALTTAKTASVASRIIPFVAPVLAVSYQAMQLSNEGKSYGEIATTIGVGIAAQAVVRPLSNLVAEGARRYTPDIVKRNIPQIVKDNAQVLVDAVVSYGVVQAASYAVTSFTRVSPESSSAPPQLPAETNPLPRTSRKLYTGGVNPSDLEILGPAPADAAFSETNPLSRTSRRLYTGGLKPLDLEILEPAPAAASSSSSWGGTMYATASTAGSKLKEIGQTSVGYVVGAASGVLSAFWAVRKIVY